MNRGRDVKGWVWGKKNEEKTDRKRGRRTRIGAIKGCGTVPGGLVLRKEKKSRRTTTPQRQTALLRAAGASNERRTTERGKRLGVRGE